MDAGTHAEQPAELVPHVWLSYLSDAGTGLLARAQWAGMRIAREKRAQGAGLAGEARRLTLRKRGVVGPIRRQVRRAARPARRG